MESQSESCFHHCGRTWNSYKKLEQLSEGNWSKCNDSINTEVYSSWYRKNSTFKQWRAIRNDVPDGEAAKELWEGIWGVEKEHNESAEWLRQFKDEMRRNNVEQERFIITEEKMQQMLRKIANWKALGPDGTRILAEKIQEYA